MFGDLLQTTQIDEKDWCLGRAGTPIVILEYADFECPFSAAARAALVGLVAAHPAEIQLVFRHFPIAATHPHAVMAAEAAEAAGAQGRFWRMHDMMYTRQRQLEYDDLRGYALNIGLDVQRFDRDMTAHRYLREVRRDFGRGIQDGVTGTPTIFINRRRYEGPRDAESLRGVILPLTYLHRQRGAA